METVNNKENRKKDLNQFENTPFTFISVELTKIKHVSDFYLIRKTIFAFLDFQL